MAYNPQAWNDGSGGGTPLSAARLDYMEEGIRAAAAAADAAGGGSITAADITDSTTTGRNVLTAASQSAARSAIGAGTSSLTIGTTGTTAAAGNDSRITGAAQRTGTVGFVQWNGNSWPSTRPDFGSIFFIGGSTRPTIMNGTTDYWVH